ncbi:MAG: ATP-dependent sacrificial sulfur transferase LarE [Thermoanaerobacteraceae bacterium]|nr:ATP-dependent sacrificial sulfur transferase LarE [Thermoanaerobacteraceae bacterium]
MNEKYDRLLKYLKGLDSVLIAFSGGVDSTLLAKASYDALGDRALAVTAVSSTYPEREREEARRYAADIGIRHAFIESEELKIEGFARNPVNRCYYCKRELFGKLRDMADREGIRFILDGTNADDLTDYRPGRKAAEEIGVVSPFLELGFTKQDIRDMSKDLGLPTWDKPAYACLSSRFPYGEEITSEKLKRVEMAEDYLLSLGFEGFRVRNHDDIARIELRPEDISRLLDEDLRLRVANKLKEIGYSYVTLDLQGYRRGSMNEVL